jgi:hypothetical protein
MAVEPESNFEEMFLANSACLIGSSCVGEIT